MSNICQIYIYIYYIYFKEDIERVTGGGSEEAGRRKTSWKGVVRPATMANHVVESLLGESSSSDAKKALERDLAAGWPLV